MRRRDGPVDLLLVCSTGGHLVQLVSLRPRWSGFSRTWVTFDKTDARSVLARENGPVCPWPDEPEHPEPAPQPWLAARILRVGASEGGSLTTGAGVAVPFAWVARLPGARIVYVESFTRIDGPVAHLPPLPPGRRPRLRRWPRWRRARSEARFAGNVFGRS